MSAEVTPSGTNAANVGSALARFASRRMSNGLSATMRRVATQKATVGFQGFRVATEVRPTDAPDMAVGSVGNSPRVSDPEVGGPMSSRTVLSTSCNYYVVFAAGIFNQVYCSI